MRVLGVCVCVCCVCDAAPHTIAIAVIIMAALWNGHHTWENWYNELKFHENHKEKVSGRRMPDILYGLIEPGSYHSSCVPLPHLSLSLYTQHICLFLPFLFFI